MTPTEVLTHPQLQPQPFKKKAQTIETTHTQSQQPSAIIMETLQSIRQQVSDQTQDIQQRASNQVEHLRNWITRSLQNSVSILREYANRYPPFAAFLFSLLVLSAIPVSIYVLFAVCTSAAILAIALIGFSIVEGTMLVCGGGILLAVLGGVCLFTLITFGFISFFYTAYRLILMMFDRAYQVGSSITGVGLSGNQSSHVDANSPTQQQS